VGRGRATRGRGAGGGGRGAGERLPPACRIRSTPVGAAPACGRRSPCVSAMTPTTAVSLPRRRRALRSMTVECSRSSLRLPRALSGTSIASTRHRLAARQEGDMHYTRISADCHIDMPWLPPDLFTSTASALMKDRMPYVVDGPDGPQWATKKGAPFGLVGGIGSTGTKYVPGQNQRVDVMAATGLYDDGKKGIRRPGDPHLRVKDMDR